MSLLHTAFLQAFWLITIHPSRGSVACELLSCFYFFIYFFASSRTACICSVDYFLVPSFCFPCFQMFTMVLSHDTSSFVQQTYVSISEWTALAFFFLLFVLLAHFVILPSSLMFSTKKLLLFQFCVHKFSLGEDCRFSEALFIFRTASVF